MAPAETTRLNKDLKSHELKGQRKGKKSRDLFVPDDPLGCVQPGGIQLEWKIRPYSMIQLIPNKGWGKEFLCEQREALQGISRGCLSKFWLLHIDL